MKARTVTVWLAAGSIAGTGVVCWFSEKAAYAVAGAGGMAQVISLVGQHSTAGTAVLHTNTSGTITSSSRLP
jgi:hypothetical protein